MAGSSYSAFYLADGLAKRGHEVWAAYKEGSFLEELVVGSGIKGAAFNHVGKFNLSVAGKLSRLVRNEKIEVINAQASPDRYITIFARWFFGMPGKLIHTRRQKPQTTGGRLKAWFYTKGTDKIIAVSQAVKDFLTTSGIPVNHIEVIPNGIPGSKWENINPIKVDALRTKYGINDGDLVIGCVSRIKKQDQILKAISRINSPVKIIFVGIADQYPHLTKIIKTLPSKQQVFFTGEIPNEEALQHYPLFTLKILPSDMEGFSQSVLEAMALGVPVIATDASGNSDLIENRVTGFLFEDNDVDELFNLIVELKSDNQLKHRIIKEARARVKKQYQMEKVILHYEKFIGQL